MSTSRTARFKIAGEHSLHCEGCEGAIRPSLLQLPGVREVKASSQAQLVEVRFDSDQVSFDELAERLRFLGYEPQAVS